MDATPLEQLKNLLAVLTAAGVSKYSGFLGGAEVELEFHPVTTTRVIDNARPVVDIGTLYGSQAVQGSAYAELLGGRLPSLAPKQGE